MDAEATVQAGACEADEGAEFGGGPLWGGSGAIATGGVAAEFLEGEELEEGRAMSMGGHNCLLGSVLGRSKEGDGVVEP